MTREEAIAILRNQHRWTGEPEKINEVRAENKALEMGIEALEQESVLDRIRQRIALEKLGYPPSAGYYKAIMKCLQIIDEYKESEDKT